MQKDTITYQLAINYLPNISIKLELLFVAITQACTENHPIIHHYALKNIIEIIKIIEKPELKSRFIKEFMRLEHILTKSTSQISNDNYAKLFVKIQILQHIAGKFGDLIHQDPFLQSIRISKNANALESELNAPQLVHWLALDASERQIHLKNWMQQLNLLYETVTVYLKVLRDSANFELIDMTSGFYNKSIANKSNCQLILLKMEKHCNLAPKIQLGHHGLSIRMCNANNMQEVKNYITTVELAIIIF